MNDTNRVKLKRLKIDQYRTIKPGTELHFSDGINVLLGKNGTGKTTLLNLLAMVERGNFYPAREEEFAVEFDFSDVEHASNWCVKLANRRRTGRRSTKTRQVQPLTMSFEISYCESSPERHRKFKIETREEDSFVIIDLQKQENYTGRLTSYRSPFNDTNSNFINIMMLTLEDQTNIGMFIGYELPKYIDRLDEARDWLNTVVEAEGLYVAFKQPGTTETVPEYTHRILFPYDMIEAFKKIFASNRASVAMIADSEAIPSLQIIVTSLGYAKAQVVLEQISSDKGQVSFGNPRFHFTKTDGTSVRLDQLSFGEQRLFAFYYYLACTAYVVIADELTNGLHHEMISGCIAAIGGRQAFLATQNPLLLDHLQFSSIAEVREAFVLCGKETSDGQEWMVMRQMAEDEGREFFGHYQVELKQVNAILRWLGLW